MAVDCSLALSAVSAYARGIILTATEFNEMPRGTRRIFLREKLTVVPIHHLNQWATLSDLFNVLHQKLQTNRLNSELPQDAQPGLDTIHEVLARQIFTASRQLTISSKHTV